ncbi:MAG: GDSL-type esterase/lipase family protein [Gammaproteobacteria bacterium]|jgi:lysophospholipase L1-like esterase|nr:GDSL-type esterase/lipase family protein [Gammaproteobacteria bacterium]MDP6616543.1 GDSL-type esterase/lipase family protein [Gammaproteobacteria bacterium]MDP6694208.1 GDSL-type esterase/lipase family protein [Gammaproteobacteria bacterium]
MTNTRKTLLLIATSLLLALVLAEVGLRTIKSSDMFPTFFDQLGKARAPIDVRDGPGMYYVHPYSAYNLKPGYSKERGERINNLGFRGEDISPEKPAGTYRIVAIGGSTTFAVYQHWSDAYPVYLQKNLQERLQTDKIEVINAGLTGSTTAESLHRLFYQILPLDPDMVVIYHGFNDLFPRIFNDYQEDYFHWRRSNTHNPPGLTRFETYRIALKVLNPVAFSDNYDLTNMVWKTENLPNSDDDRLANFFASDSGAFERNLDYMITSLQARGVQPVLATFAIRPDIVHWNDYLPAFAWEEGIRQNNAAIERVAAARDVPLVPFAEEVADLPKVNLWRGMRRGCCYTDSIHFSPEGNKIKAGIFTATVAPLVRQGMQPL